MVLIPLTLHRVVFEHFIVSPTSQESTERSSQSLQFLLMKHFFLLSLWAISFSFFFFTSSCSTVALYTSICSVFPAVWWKPLSACGGGGKQCWQLSLSVPTLAGAPDFIACSGPSYQLMCVPGVQLTSALAQITYISKSHECRFVLVIFKHIARGNIRTKPRKAFSMFLMF